MPSISSCLALVMANNRALPQMPDSLRFKHSKAEAKRGWSAVTDPTRVFGDIVRGTRILIE